MAELGVKVPNTTLSTRETGNVNARSPIKDPLVDDTGLWIFQWVFYGFVFQIVDIFGVVTNTINIICFIKQGFKDSVNVSLLGLAISDLGCLLSLLWTNMCFVPAFQESSPYFKVLPFESVEFQYLTTGWPHVIFTRVTSCITAFITLERCLCITMPLKVKNILTPKRVTLIIVCIFIILICNVSPIYYANRLAMKFSPERNRTILRLVYTDDRIQVEQIAIAINNIFTFGSFMIIITCTIILTAELRKKANWRSKCTAPVTSDTMSERDLKVAKMVLMISILFIACFIPACLLILCIIIEPELAIDGLYSNTMYILVGLGFLMESINSASNIFIYYKISSRYSTAFRQVFCVWNKTKLNDA